MSCSPIARLSLDSESRAALKRINAKPHLTSLLGTTLTIGVFNNIFIKSKPPVATFNITTVDWVLCCKAMSKLPNIQKQQIQKEAERMILHYHMAKYNLKHLQFWTGIKYGCR